MQERLTNALESSLLPTLKARDAQAEGYEAGLRRATPQVGTIVKGLVEGDERVMLPTPRANEPGSTSAGYGDSLNDFANRVVNGYARKDIELLRSPKASEGQGGALGEAEARKRGNTVGVRDQIMDLVASQGHRVSRAMANLPTPTVSDQFTANLTSSQQKEGSLHSVSLAQIVHRADLFPTPNTMEHREVKTPEQIAELKAKSPGGYRNLRESVINELPVFPTPVASEGLKAPAQQDAETKSKTGQVWLSNEAKGLSNKNIGWGKFEPAIRRWEALLGRPAPSPTKADGKDGAHRLSSSFTEWMMGLPEDWICGHDLKRNDELKLAGNGVVPQQAELALRLLLETNERED